MKPSPFLTLMIYLSPIRTERIDRGDLIDGCPVSKVTTFNTDQLDTAKVLVDLQRVAKHFADTFSRIGLPQPDETLYV